MTKRVSKYTNNTRTICEKYKPKSKVQLRNKIFKNKNIKCAPKKKV